MSDESHKERVDRELIELLNELRVALPGVQVLFAFLLVLPFQQRWEQSTDIQRIVYFVALAASAVAGALLMAPSIYHRLNFRRKVKEQMLFDANHMFVAAMSFLAAGIIASLFVIADFLYGPMAGIGVAALSTLVFAWLWYVFPLRRRGAPDEPDAEGSRQV